MNIGSFWHKWDLHIHTPLSIDQQFGGYNPINWEKYIKDLEDLPKDFKVLGINDYFTIEGYEKLLDNQSNDGRLVNRILFPVIELRVRAFGNLSNRDSWKRVNLHVIFNNTEIDKIKSQFLNLLEIDCNGFKSKGLTKDNIIAFGEHQIKDTPEDKRIEKSPLKVGFKNLNFDHRAVCSLLEGSGLDYLIAIGKSEWDSMRWDGSAAEKKDIINRSHIIFTATENKVTFGKGKLKLEEQGIKNPLLDCSDAHHFSDSKDKDENLIKDRIGNCLTWIKAEPTFEGLKQVIHAPKTRVIISENKPIPPVRRINSLVINLPENTNIIRKEDIKDKAKEAVFCFAGNHNILFSPYFTCLIGGRGSGKSTILNLIAEKLLDVSSSKKEAFFNLNVLKVEDKKIKANDYINVEGTTEIEFISQNEVERFASSGEITEAIYDRLIHDNHDEFSTFENKMKSHISYIDNQIKCINDYHQEESKIKDLENQLNDNKNIIFVDSLDNPEYKKINTEISLLLTRKQNLEKDKKEYEDLIKELQTITQKNDSPSKRTIYKIEINNIIKSLKVLIKAQTDLSQGDKELLELENKQSNLLRLLDEYLTKQGVSAENISDYERANSIIPSLRTQIHNSKLRLGKLKLKIKEFEKIREDINKAKSSYEEAISLSLQPLNDKLKNINSEVEDIRFEYEFNDDEALNQLFDEFETHFKDFKPSEHRTRFDAVREYLLCIEPKKVDNYEEYMMKLEARGSAVKAKEYIKKIFSEKVNFETYKLLIMKVYKDAFKFKKIKGFYGNRELKSCSFGQRCTAVIVALTMFGNKPLIIDEPEAHLDSKLIAEYLVNLIKERKHDRQIIFATHNANFVVNGDAELINILEVDKNTNITSIIPCTIESLEHRDKLLHLEGGKEAFKKREERLII